MRHQHITTSFTLKLFLIQHPTQEKVREAAEISTSISLVIAPPMAVSSLYKNLFKNWLLFFDSSHFKGCLPCIFIISLLFPQYNVRDISMTGQCSLLLRLSWLMLQSCARWFSFSWETIIRGCCYQKRKHTNRQFPHFTQRKKHEAKIICDILFCLCCRHHTITEMNHCL